MVYDKGIMSNRSVPFAVDEYYHLYNRGNSKQTIFLDTADHQRFLQLLYVANGTKSFKLRELRNQNMDIYDLDMGDRLVAIGVYCLMPNHFHLLIKPLVENGVSQFMKKVSTGYVMYFNQKYDRTGTLFEGKFKSRYVDSDEYLKYLYAYILLNPVKLIQADWKEKGIEGPSEAEQFLREYRFSAYNDLLVSPGRTWGDRKTQKILSPQHFPNYFCSRAELDAELLSWLNFSQVGPVG